jgi:CBS domain containing-hemolysin-like protein
LDLTLPDDQFDTMGGFIFGRVNRIPRVNDRVVVEGGAFRVSRMRGRRVDFVDFEPAEPT